jgi:xylan 1,4-beta-xylosidase
MNQYGYQKKRLAGPRTKTRETEAVLCESSSLYRRNGWRYLMLAESGTDWNHGLAMARAKNTHDRA